VTDWLVWYEGYETYGSELAQRLAVVRQLLDETVASVDQTSLRVLSICAGDGRDVLPVLARWRERKEIHGWLIELEPELAKRARLYARAQELGHVDVVCADAASPVNLLGAIPADLILLCGVFGNVSDGDVRQLVESLPSMCASAANVVWTRHRRHPDLTPTIREWFATVGFAERAFRSPGTARFSVARHQMVVPPRRQPLRDPLFTFLR
jgi:hypothetical protein